MRSGHRRLSIDVRLGEPIRDERNSVLNNVSNVRFYY